MGRKRKALQTIFVDDTHEEGEDTVVTVGFSDTVSAGGRSVTRCPVVHTTPRSPPRTRKTYAGSAADTTDPDDAFLGDQTAVFDEGIVVQIEAAHLQSAPRKSRRNNYLLTSVCISRGLYFVFH